MTTPLVIWRVTDGKPGHDRQSLGLARALAAATGTECHDLASGSPGAAVAIAFAGRRDLDQLPAPDLILGAGHATHAWLLAAGRRYGGRTIVLMKPSLPHGWFSLCLVPRHDRVPPADNIIETTGALNPVRPGAARDGALAVVLIGGPSRHHCWDTGALARELAAVMAASAAERWLGSGSRRTPDEVGAALRALGIDFHAADQLPGDWVDTQLAVAGEVWVSADSVSMIYEALTGGGSVGIL
ncbi:MAG: hypothetical protein HKO62_11360, partial [Gammaproteobacteria bacterium]|nr:hypothetical protein [Gammaproteobacteria bacterium]